MAVHAANFKTQSQTSASENGSAEWPVLYSQYLTRSANQSAKTLALFQDVMDCVARNELPATVLQDSLPSFIQSRGTIYTNALTEISLRFFAGIVQISHAYSNELTELAVSDVALAPVQPPDFDTSDAAKWYQQLNDYVSKLTARAMSAYQALLQKVAAGSVSPTQFQELASTYYEQRLPTHLQHLAALYFAVLNGLSDLQSGFQEEYLRGVLASVNKGDQEMPFILNLTAPLGESASASLALANTEDSPATIRCVVNDIRRADGVGSAFIPKLVINPAAFNLRPGDEVNIMISLNLDKNIYHPDSIYVGSLSITGHSELSLEVPLQIRATSG